nr:unnamed protein product [Digitaria exilis]
MASMHSFQSASHLGELRKPGAVALVTSTCTGIPGTTNFSWSSAAAAPVISGVDVAEGVEAGRPMEEEPGDAEACGNAGRPAAVAPVGDEAARPRRQTSEVHLEGPGELLQGVEQGDGVVFVRDLVHVLDARRQAVDAGRERELDELQGEVGAGGLLSDAAQPSAVHRRRDEARARAALGEEAGEVDHGDGMALRHEGDDDKVSRWRRRR